MIDGRNGAKVIQDISRLLVPSVEALATRNARLECLIESVNEGWNNAIPFTDPRPQPDYAVGFKHWQSAHGMSLAVRAIVELFRLVKREEELHRQILVFSISHDHRSVRIYSHYPVINGKDTTFFRHPICAFDFTAMESKEKWTSYRFIRNVYDIWLPNRLDKIRSVIDDLPSDFDFEVPLLPEESGLPKGFESHLSHSSTVPSWPSSSAAAM
ncbi:hypothetical protein PTNB73_02802 [Pyrenophora teres f. teres]|nr:hypothetical protein HRS9122_09558 [Pyrenophora teres f. teres]KAE8839180.1 hypothetical protein HRS9139_03563 [Pyrenophora teres f. teres]KAE8845145.1 hypothetical protein PTNB85_03410 [Pyrenophora teres f. teres]KAE8865708.1 hypothetical protein PTNB29_02855 [Pyrenophora teres f. teres]KAE8871343.1 hypothetical protein PTNB73_02802 [Pyrenophora teres f. teres]